MNHSAHAPTIQALPLPTPKRIIGMDFMSPFCIYVDGVEFSSFPTIQAAEAVYAELREKMNPTVCGVQ